MQFSTLSYKDIPKYTPLIQDYLHQEEKVSTFVEYPFSLNSIPQITENFKQFKVHRKLLHQYVVSQYEGIERNENLQKNIDRIVDENTYTVTTAHQLIILTGPLYFIYKICNTITIANNLNRKFPDKHFVPVFWMGSEDHDFEEINHIHLSGSRHEWKSEQQGATGEFNLNKISSFFHTIKEFFKDNIDALGIISSFEERYNSSEDLTQATFNLLHSLFGRYGLIVVDGNSSFLKSQFLTIMEQELIERKSDDVVKETQAKLIAAGYHAQAHSREINLFYKIKGLRERIVFESGMYKINNTQLQFSEKEILEELNQYPERFSPNVILRPLYQQMILPNVMYVGGGGEIAYWMQLKELFKMYKVHYPMLVLRTSAHILSASFSKRINKLHLPLNTYFGDVEQAKKDFLAIIDEDGILHIEDEKNNLLQIVESLQRKADKVDSTLVGWVGAEGAKMEKILEQIFGRLLKTKKSQEETHLHQIEKIIHHFTPNNSLQERFENFLPYYVKYGTAFFDALIKELNPMDKRFTILEE